MSTVSRSVNKTVSGVQRFGKSQLDFLVRDDSTFTEDVTKVVFKATTCAFGSTLLPWTLRINEVLKTPIFGDVS